MKFLIQNVTSEDKFIVRFRGDTLCIPKHDFIEFDSDNANECRFWSNLTLKPTPGMNIITDISRIRLMNKLKACGKYKVTENTVTTLEPVVEETEIISTVPDLETLKEAEPVETIVEEINAPIDTEVTLQQDVVETDTLLEKSEAKEMETDNVNTNEWNEEVVSQEITDAVVSPTFTEEELSTKNKSELQEILDTYNVEYKKNNSNTTLIKLILENCN